MPTQPSMRTRCTSRQRIPQQPAAAAPAHLSDAWARPMPVPTREPGWPIAQRAGRMQSPPAQRPAQPARRSGMPSPTRRAGGRRTRASRSLSRRRRRPRRVRRSARAPQPAQPSAGRIGKLSNARRTRRRTGHRRGRRRRARTPSRQQRQPLTPRRALHRGSQKGAHSLQVSGLLADDTSCNWLALDAESSSLHSTNLEALL